MTSEPPDFDESRLWDDQCTYELVDDDARPFSCPEILSRIRSAFPRSTVDYDAARERLRRQHDFVSKWNPSVYSFRFPTEEEQKAAHARHLQGIRALEGIAALVRIPLFGAIGDDEIDEMLVLTFVVEDEPIKITFHSREHLKRGWPVVEKLASTLGRRIERFHD